MGIGKSVIGKAFKNASADSLSIVDKAVQRGLGIAKKDASGAIQYKALNGLGFAAVAGGSMAISTGKAISGRIGQSTRGMVSVADGMDRFVSYDGSGFINNIENVAGGDPAIMEDIVNHAFVNQRISSNLGDIVFALHANREG